MARSWHETTQTLHYGQLQEHLKITSDDLRPARVGRKRTIGLFPLKLKDIMDTFKIRTWTFAPKPLTELLCTLIVILKNYIESSRPLSGLLAAVVSVLSMDIF